MEASSAIVFPADASNESDMRSILTILAIESINPGVRTVVEVNNPKHVDHFKRAKANEILVTSPARLAAARPLGALPRPGRAGHRHRLRRRRLRALPREPPGRLRRHDHRRARRCACGPTTAPRCSRSPATASAWSTRRRTSACGRATTPSCWPRPWATWCRCRSPRTRSSRPASETPARTGSPSWLASQACTRGTHAARPRRSPPRPASSSRRGCRRRRRRPGTVVSRVAGRQLAGPALLGYVAPGEHEAALVAGDLLGQPVAAAARRPAAGRAPRRCAG